jgi:hypothetical protein
MCSGLLLLLLSTVPTQGSQQQQHSIPSVRLALRITIEYGTIRETRQGQKRMVPETRKLVTNTWDNTSFEFNRYNLSHAVLCCAMQVYACGTPCTARATKSLAWSIMAGIRKRTMKNRQERETVHCV